MFFGHRSRRIVPPECLGAGWRVPTPGGRPVLARRGFHKDAVIGRLCAVHPPADLDHLWRPDDRPSARRAGPDDRDHGAANRCGRAGRARLLLMGRDGLSLKLDRLYAALREDQRCVRAARDLPGSHLDLSGGLASGGHRAKHAAAHRVPRGARHGRRRLDSDGVHRRRRCGLPARARALHRIVRRRLGICERHRPADRRLHCRQHVVALGLSDQSAGRHDGAGRDVEGVASSGRASTAPDRHRRRAVAGRGSKLSAAGAGLGWHRVSLGLADHRDAHPRGRAVDRGVRDMGDADGRTDPAIASVSGSARVRKLRAQLPHRVRALRQRGFPPLVPAGGHRGVGDHLRPVARAADGRHRDGVRGIRSDHQPHGPVPACGRSEAWQWPRWGCIC